MQEKISCKVMFVCDCAPLLVVISLLVDLGIPIYTILGLVN